MIEFDDKDLRDLQDVDGILLQDVHGQRVAIGKGFDYENIFQFMSAYFEEYGAEDFVWHCHAYRFFYCPHAIDKLIP